MDKIKLEQVRYVYGAGTPFEQVALDGVDLSIKGGCITGIIGHTGSGKSTMMQLLNGLSSPTSGKVFLDGVDIHAKPEEVYEAWKKLPEYQSLSKRAQKKAMREKLERNRRNLCFRVGLVMQYPEYQLFEETVFRDIAFGPSNMGLPKEEISARVYEAMEFVGLDRSLSEQSPFDLSGGQKRRVALAGVIAMRPEVLVLDEPAAGLDPRGKDQIFERICAYQKSTASTVLIVSHSMEDMAKYCDEIVVMDHAKVSMKGTCKEIFAQTQVLSQSGLDIPQITQMMHLLKKAGLPVSENVYTVEEAIKAVSWAFENGKELEAQ